MDTNSVQAAFGTVPAVSGNFGWSPAHDVMTFTPANRWPRLTNIIVRVTNSAVAAVSGNTMFAPYQMQFIPVPALPSLAIDQITITNSIIQLFCPSVTNWSYQLLGEETVSMLFQNWIGRSPAWHWWEN